MGKLIPNPAPPASSPPPVAGEGIAVTSTAAGTEISNTGVLSVNNKTGDVTLPSADALPSTYELAPYHGAYPNVLHSPFYLIPSRVGGIYLNSTNATIDGIGTDPYDIAITPDGKYAYVANNGSGSVSVIDISANTVTTVSVGSGPFGVAITPDGKYAYVTNYSSGSVSVIDISTNTVIATVTVGTGPSGVAITPDGKYAYVTNNGSKNVSVIDISTNTVTTTVTAGSGPYDVAITPDGKYAYVTNFDSNNVSVIDISTNTVTATVGVGSDPISVAITPDGKYAYVTNNEEDNVSIIDISTNTEITTVTVGAYPAGVAITPDGKYAYVTSDSGNNVWVIDISGYTLLTTVTISSDSFGIAFTPDGRYAYVVNISSSSVSVIETAVPEYDIQDLTEQTSTATTAPGLSIGSITFTVGYTGTVYLEAIVRGSNNTVGDGITVGLYNGTTLLDSETYTQEGAASNQHTFSLFYALSVSPGGSYTISVYILAVTGGTAQAKLVRLKARDQY